MLQALLHQSWGNGESWAGCASREAIAKQSDEDRIDFELTQTA
jgi:hypothetical protein